MGGFTVWQGVGLVAGAALGFVTGGAGWALAGSILMGATVGYGIGTMLDPSTADVPQAGEPQVGKLDIPLNEEGAVIPDILGTQRVAGMFMWYDGARSKEVKEKVKGGKGGGKSKKVTVGYKYYLSWQLGLCWGPADELITVLEKDEVLWDGSLTDTGTGYQSITLANMGSATFYFGTENQPRNTLIGGYVGNTDNPPYRKLCHIVMNDCYIGSYNRATGLTFIIRKTPAFSWTYHHRIGLYDYNAICACYYILHTLAGLPSTWFDEDAIASAASESAGISESHGISMLFSSQRPAQQYLETILMHVGGLMRYTNESKFTFELLRATTAALSLESISDDDFVEEPVVVRKTWMDVPSDIKVQHHMRYNVYGTEVEGYPDIYSFVFIDESQTAPSYYTDNSGALGVGWVPDYTAAKVSPKPGQKGDGNWYGFVGHIRQASYEYIKPNSYSWSQIYSEIGINDAFEVPYSPTGQEAVNKLEDHINFYGWRPGSWFVFTRDVTGSNDATQLANGAEQIANLKSWIQTNYPDSHIYQHDETATNERWLDWIITNVTLS